MRALLLFQVHWAASQVLPFEATLSRLQKVHRLHTSGCLSKEREPDRNHHHKET